MAIECNAIVPEVEVKFPAVMYGDVNGAKVLAINKDIAIPEHGGVLSFTHLVDRYIPCPPGSKFVMKITAEDGSEWPRIERHRDFGTRWLCVENTAFAARRGSVAMALDSCMGKPPGRVEPAVACTPLPPGTITTITFCDGVWTCEIEEPEKDWLPVALNGFGGHGMQIRRADPSRAHVVINEVIVLDSQAARQLSEVAARFADEQEFPGESLPMKWTDEDMDLPPSRIDSDGHLELEKEWIRSEYEADRLMRAIRLYKRHLQDQAKV